MRGLGIAFRAGTEHKWADRRYGHKSKGFVQSWHCHGQAIGEWANFFLPKEDFSDLGDWLSRSVRDVARTLNAPPPPLRGRRAMAWPWHTDPPTCTPPPPQRTLIQPGFFSVCVLPWGGGFSEFPGGGGWVSNQPPTGPKKAKLCVPACLSACLPACLTDRLTDCLPD